MKSIWCMIGLHKLEMEEQCIITARYHCIRCHCKFIDSLFGLFKV